MKKARMNISHFRFILFDLKIFGEIVTTNYVITYLCVTLLKSLTAKQPVGGIILTN